MANKPTYKELEQKVKDLEGEIREHREIERVLQESEARYNALFHRSLDCVYLHDFEGNFIDANPAALDLLGYNKEEISSVNFATLLSPDQFPNALEVLREVKKLGYDPKLREFRLQDKYGHYVWVEAKSSMIFRDGNPFLIQGIARDITERKLGEEVLKASEKKYRIILESIEDGYFEVDLSGNLTFVNDSLVRISGYSRDELMGMNNREYTTPENAKRMYQIFNQVYQTGKPVKVTDHEIIGKDGNTIVLEMSTSLMRDLSGKPIGFQGIARDVTERKMREEALRQAAALETLTTVLENFISDSLGNLLTPIYSRIQLCQMRDNIDQIKSEIGDTERGITELLTGINTFRKFAKSGEGYLGRISSVDIRSILRPLLSGQSLKTYGEEELPIDPNVKLRFVYDPKQGGELTWEELPPVLGSEIAIETALQETLINAVESYDPNRGGEVMVSAKKEDHQLILEIADKGRGMSHDEKEKSQLPFFKIPGMKKSARFGLGAYIACESAKYCEGDIQIESTKGVGTKASILLKLGDSFS